MRGFARALALAGVLFCAPAAIAQTIDAPLRVRTGDVYTVAVEQTQTSAVAGTEVEATFSHTYALHIVDAEQRIWRYVPVSINYTLPTGLGLEAETAGLNWPIINEAVSALTRVSTDIGFECRVDEFGRCLELTNWPMWRDRAENVIIMADAFARLMPQTAASGEEVASAPEIRATPPRAGVKQQAGVAGTAFTWERMREPVLRGVATMLDSFDGRDAATWMAVIQNSAFLQGRPLTRRQPVSVSDEFEMPFGAPPLRFTGTLQLDRVSQRDNSATVVRRVTLDETSARATLQSMTQFTTSNLVLPVANAAGEAQSAEALTSVIQPMLDALSMRYEETTTGIVDLNTGMAREATTQYTFTLLPTGGAGETPVTVEGRTVVRITPGAPNVTRLPRP